MEYNAQTQCDNFINHKITSADNRARSYSELAQSQAQGDEMDN